VLLPTYFDGWHGLVLQAVGAKIIVSDHHGLEYQTVPPNPAFHE